MAYYLQFDGVNDLVLIPVIDLAVGESVDFFITGYDGPSTSNTYIADGAGGAGGRGYVYIASNGVFDYNSAIMSATVDGTPISPGNSFPNTGGGDQVISITASAAVTFSKIGCRVTNNETWAWGIKSVIFKNSGGTAIRDYDPSATGGTGLVLEDTVGSNDGTLVNFPGDNSQWVFYSAGGTITVTGATSTYSYNAISASVDLTGSIEVTGATASYSYNAVSATIDLTGAIDITATTPSYSYQAISATIDLTPEITVTGATSTYSYQAIAGVVELGAVINVTGATPNYSYSAQAATVTLQGTIDITGATSTYSYQAISASVQVGDIQYAIQFSGTIKDSSFTGLVKAPDLRGTIKESTFSGIIGNNNLSGSIG